MKQIYLNEYNIPINGAIYVPYSSGLLKAYALTSPTIVQNYNFQPFIFLRDTVDNIISLYDNPDVVGFSVSVWNFELSVAVAKKLKEKFPNCLIVFGGPNVPMEGKGFFEKYPFIDLGVYGAGEKVFKDILINRTNNMYDGNSSVKHFILYWTDQPKDLDEFPSPYTMGLFNDIIKKHPEIKFQPIIETNRGCPFQCAFCFWGQKNLSKKMSFHSLDYIQKDAEWIGKTGLEYIFCADSNYGMFKQDIEISQIYANTKQKYGNPDKFRVCYGKNAEESVYQSAKILSETELAKTVTLSVQSSSPKVLDAVGRKNIRLKTFQNLQQRYIKDGIPTYTEIIMGLPNETYESFLNTIESTLQIINDNMVFIYHCQMLPNTKLDSKEYREKYGLITQKVPLCEIHGSVRSDDLIQEHEELIIGNNTMSVDEWKKLTVISMFIQLLHGLKLGYDIVKWVVDAYDVKYTDFYNYLAISYTKESRFFWQVANDVVEGRSKSQHNPKFGDVYYEPEEIAFLNIICESKDFFYKELTRLIEEFLDNRNLSCDVDYLDELVYNQIKRLPNIDDFDSTQDFAIEAIFRGRKSNNTTLTTKRNV